MLSQTKEKADHDRDIDGLDGVELVGNWHVNDEYLFDFRQSDNAKCKWIIKRKYCVLRTFSFSSKLNLVNN